VLAEHIKVRTVINERDEQAKADSLEAERAQLEAELKTTQAALEVLKAKQAALQQTKLRLKARTVLGEFIDGSSNVAGSSSVASLQNAFFRSLLAANEKKPPSAAMQDYRDALLKYLTSHPKAADVPDAMLQIELTYRAQG